MWTATPASSKYCKSTSLTMMQKSENIPVSSFCMRSMPFLYPWVLEAMAKWFRKPQIRRGEGGGCQAWPLSSAGTSHRGPSLAKPLGWSPDSQSRRWRTSISTVSLFLWNPLTPCSSYCISGKVQKPCIQQWRLKRSHCHVQIQILDWWYDTLWTVVHYFTRCVFVTFLDRVLNELLLHSGQ